MENVGEYNKNLLHKMGIPHKNIVQRAKVSSKTLDNFLNDRVGISKKSMTAILDAIRYEVFQVEVRALKKEKDRVFMEVQRNYELLADQAQFDLLEYIRGLTRAERARTQ
jgi:hypothetical protein